MQGTADQNENHVSNEPILEHASEVSFPVAVNGSFGGPSQSSKIRNDPERAGVSEEME